MNPNATAFVPRFAAKESPAPQLQTSQAQQTSEVQPQHNIEGQNPTPKIATEVSDPQNGSKLASKPAEKKEASETMNEDEGPTEEELKELKRMEKEEMDTLAEDFQNVEFVEDNREHINIVFIGHVDAGKSTISGQILFSTGMVDQRTIQKYEREAKDKNRESWFLAYIMDTNEEERAKGKTVEVGRAHFETQHKRYTILDAPGHKNYVPNMIGGAAQADIGILVISVRKGEFESGFNRGGQTREHTMLAKTLGLKQLIIVVNKMDDPTVNWDKARYDEVVKELNPFLKQVGYNPEKDVVYIPISGIKGYNIKDRLDKSICPWYNGPSLLEALDNMKPLERLDNWPFRLPIIDKYKERGLLWVHGKVETGSLAVGTTQIVIPNRMQVEVAEIMLDDTKNMKVARPGENIKIGLKGIDEDNIHRGYVLCDPKVPIACQAKFEAQLAILELLPHKSVFSAGYSAVLHIHTAVEECNIVVLLDQLDKKTGAVAKKKPMFVTNGALVRCIIECSQPICLELFSSVPQLGRFTLRDEGKTIAIGKVTALGPRKKQEGNPNGN